MSNRQALIELMNEAERRGDMETAKKALVRLEGMQPAPNPVVTAQPAAQPVPDIKPVIQEKLRSPDVQLPFATREQRKQNIQGYLGSIKSKADIPSAFMGVAAEVVKSGWDIFSEIASAVTPDQVGEFLQEWADQEIQANLDTPQGRMLTRAFEEYGEWAKEHPQGAKDFENSLTVAAAVSPGIKGLKRTFKGDEFIDVIRPKMTVKVMKQMQPQLRMERGLTGKKFVYKPTTDEKLLAEAVSQVKGTSPKKLLKENIVLVNKEIDRLTKGIVDDLSKAGVKYSRSDFLMKLNSDMRTMFRESKVYRKARAKSPNMPNEVKDVIADVLDEVNRQGGGLDGLLKARKALDFEYKNAMKWNKGTGAFIETKKSAAYRQARDTINNFIDTKAADVGLDVAAPRKQSHLLIRANTNMGTKDKPIGFTPFERFKEGRVKTIRIGR